jgi:hypothetical protein
MLKYDLSDRYLCSHLVSVIAQSREPQPVLPGNLEEIGETSALLSTSRPICRGTKIRIECARHRLYGVVQISSFEESMGYLLEVELDAESRWSEDRFTPDHLLKINGMPQVFPVGLASGY